MLAKFSITSEHGLMFTLDPTLQRDCFPIRELSCSQLLLMGDARYPWFIVVPTIPELREIHDMDRDDQIRVLDDMTTVSRAVQKIYTPSKINIAALGNIVQQLHIHVIARFSNDDSWPDPVWGKGETLHYEEGMLLETIAFMNDTLEEGDL